MLIRFPDQNEERSEEFCINISSIVLHNVTIVTV
jgi:hypothetical protein